MQRSCTYRDVCLSSGAKHTTEFNGAEERNYKQKEIFNIKNYLWADNEETGREKEPKETRQNGRDDSSGVEGLTC